METATNNPRHRIDAAQALRQASLGTDGEAKAQAEKFTININFDTNKVTKEITLTPRPEQETLTIDGLPTPRETGLTRAITREGDDHD
jgi:hypothetical protein